MTPTVCRCGAVFIFSTPTVCMTPSVFLHKIMHEIMHKINQNDAFIFNILQFILNLCIYFKKISIFLFDQGHAQALCSILLSLNLVIRPATKSNFRG